MSRVSPNAGSLDRQERALGIRPLSFLDGFGEGFGMKIEGTHKTYTSIMGVVLTLVFAVMTALFAYARAMVLIQKSDVTVMGSTSENEFDFNYVITPESGFFVAFALTEYNSDPEIIEKPEYGEMVMEYYGWGYSQTAIGSSAKPLGYHYCSDEELGLERGPNTLAYPIFESSINEVRTWKKKFKCADQDTL